MKTDRQWYIWLTIASLAAGTIYPFAKFLSPRISPLSLAFFRYTFALVPMLPFFLFEVLKNGKTVRRKDFFMLSLLGLLGVTVFSILFFYGVVLSTGTNGSLLVNTQPIFASLLAPLLIRERFSFKNVLASIVGVVGITIIVTGGRLQAFSFARTVVLGNLLLLTASIALTLYSILLKKYIIKYKGTIPTFVTMCSGAAALLVIVLVIQGKIADFKELRTGDFILLFSIGAFSTAMLYLLFNRALEVLGAVRSIGFKLLIPIFGIILSILLLGERPKPITYGGFGIVFVSLLFIQWKGRKHEAGK